jgi:hypothetical protein
VSSTKRAYPPARVTITGITLTGRTEYELVTPLESFERQRQPAKDILAIRIRAGNGADQFRLELP